MQKVFEKIVKATTSKIVWDMFVKYYGGDTKVNKVRLKPMRMQYEMLQMKNDELVADYFPILLTITNQKKNYCEILIENVVQTLTLHYDMIIVTTEKTNHFSKLKIKELHDLVKLV